MSLEDDIVRHIELRASPDKVWRAITEPEQFGAWFQCVVEGRFSVGEITGCHSEHEGARVHWQILVKSMEREQYFAYVWSPGDTGADLFDESVGQTLVEFTLAATETGTYLTIRESGFASLPEHLRKQSFTRNTEGWNAQVENITTYVDR